jgi:hypothetical protein
MAAPPVTVRITPSGFVMPDGFKTLVAFHGKPDIQLWEHALGGVTPPGLDGGEKIVTTTMHNVKYRTARAKKLIDTTDASFKCAYDPDVINDILQQLNREQGITYQLADGSTWTYWGFLKMFKPGPCEEGKMPEAEVTICHTNWDPQNSVEAGPVFVPAAGT